MCYFILNTLKFVFGFYNVFNYNCIFPISIQCVYIVNPCRMDYGSISAILLKNLIY